MHFENPYVEQILMIMEVLEERADPKDNAKTH